MLFGMEESPMVPTVRWIRGAPQPRARHLGYLEDLTCTTLQNLSIRLQRMDFLHELKVLTNSVIAKKPLLALSSFAIQHNLISSEPACAEDFYLR